MRRRILGNCFFISNNPKNLLSLKNCVDIHQWISLFWYQQLTTWCWTRSKYDCGRWINLCRNWTYLHFNTVNCENEVLQCNKLQKEKERRGKKQRSKKIKGLLLCRWTPCGWWSGDDVAVIDRVWTRLCFFLPRRYDEWCDAREKLLHLWKWRTKL